MNIQELIKMLADWTDQSTHAQWNLTHAHRRLVLNLTARGTDRKVTFVTCGDWPEQGLVRGAIAYVDGLDRRY